MSKLPDFDRRFAAADRPARPQHHVDDREERAGAVERRAGSADDLDAIDERQIDRELVADERLVVDVVVVAVAVDQHQHAVVVVARPAEPAHADVGVVAVVGHVEAAHAAQGVGERAPAERPDVLGGDDRHRRRRFGHPLLAPRGAEHGAHLDRHQVLEALVRQRRRIGRRSPGAWRGRRRHRRERSAARRAEGIVSRMVSPTRRCGRGGAGVS